MKLASIETIHSIQPHPNADKLVKAKVLEWPVVVKKDEFKEGEKVVFIFPDVIVDSENPYFSFLSEKKFRVWNARLRGEVSSGLVCPLTLLNDYGVGTFVANNILQEGMDVSDIIKAKKYERPIPAELAGNALGNFPTNYVRKTDEDNLLSHKGILKEFDGKESYISMKMDGSSATYIYNQGEFLVCSRNLALKESETNSFWVMVRKLDLQKKLAELGRNLAIQGELCGPSIQQNRIGLKEINLYIFNIKDLDSNRYFGLEEIEAICAQLGLNVVPVLQRNVFVSEISTLQEIANNLKYQNGQDAEGIVIRPMKPVFSEKLHKELSVKIINQNYK